MAHMEYNGSTMYSRGVVGVNVTADLYGYTVYEQLNPKNDTAYMGVSMFRRVSMPLICALGIIGNVLTTATFLSGNLPKTSFNRYLIARSVSDAVFLVTLLFGWLDSVDIRVFHTNVLCQSIVFASYVSSLISVWMVVAVTCENYVRLCHPTMLHVYCTAKKSRNIIIVTILVAMATYIVSLWITNMTTIKGVSVCITNAEYQHIYIILTYIDTILTLLIPFVLIVSLSMAIVCSMVEAYKRRMRMRTVSGGARMGTLELLSLLPEARVTRMLFAVSFIFLILHFPFHVIRFKMIIDIFIIKSDYVTPTDPTLKKTFETLYYSNFTVNFMVYFIFGRTFRKRFFALFCDCASCHIPKRRSIHGDITELERLNGTTDDSDAKRDIVTSTSVV